MQKNFLKHFETFDTNTLTQDIRQTQTPRGYKKVLSAQLAIEKESKILLDAPFFKRHDFAEITVHPNVKCHIFQLLQNSKSRFNIKIKAHRNTQVVRTVLALNGAFDEAFKICLGHGARFKNSSFNFCDGFYNSHLKIMHHQNSQSDIFGINFGKKEAFLRLQTHIVHKENQTHTTSNQFIKNIADDHSTTVFEGLIEVQRGADFTATHQKSNSVFLSPDAQIISVKPELKIDTDKLEASHGASIGSLDTQQLFFLQSRGLTPKMAKKVISDALWKKEIDTLDNVLQDHIKVHIN